MFIVQYRSGDISFEEVDLNSYLSKFSHCLRHCKEALLEIEHYKFFSLVTASELRRIFLKTFEKLEYTLKEISQSDTLPGINQKYDFNTAQDQIIPEEKTMLGSLNEVHDDERNPVKSDSTKYISSPSDDPGFLKQSYKKASTLILRSQPITFENSQEPYLALKSNLNEPPHDTDSEAVKHKECTSDSSYQMPDVISNIGAGVAGIASLVGLTNSPKQETRGLDIDLQTNHDIIEPPQTDNTMPLPLKPANVNDSIPIDPPIDLNNKNGFTNKNFAKEELNEDADALIEIGQSIPITRTGSPNKVSSENTTKELAIALNETSTFNTQKDDQQRVIHNSDSDSIDTPSTRSIMDKPTSAEVNELKSAIDANVKSFTEDMDEIVNARPGLMKNEDGSFGYATIIVPEKEISEDMKQDAIHLKKIKVHTDSLDHDDINDRSFHVPSNEEEMKLEVIDSCFKSSDGKTRAASVSSINTDRSRSDYPAHRSSEIKELERGIEDQLLIMSNSVNISNDNESSFHKTPVSSAQLQSNIFHDKSTAEAIESLYSRSNTTKNNKRVSMGDKDEPVLYVRNGFENFIGFGLKCLSKDRLSSV